ncbi:MAG: hypothetical protein MHPSP_003221 [Paramarteilia canceri]
MELKIERKNYHVLDDLIKSDPSDLSISDISFSKQCLNKVSNEGINEDEEAIKTEISRQKIREFVQGHLMTLYQSHK